MPKGSEKTHWICKDCIIQNHISRESCLSCNMPKSVVELKEKWKKKLVMNEINPHAHYSNRLDVT